MTSTPTVKKVGIFSRVPMEITFGGDERSPQ
jgi:hypothetical protein